MGAWIETAAASGSANKRTVAPYVGAWIETDLQKKSIENAVSHPTWVRGLKLKP